MASLDRDCRIVLLILASALALPAQTAPPDLLKRVLERETETERERGNYAYRQSVRIEEMDTRGARRGEYRETREVIFTPEGKRLEDFAGKPFDRLDRLRLTEEDFRDIREVQPFLFTRDQLRLYETKFRGEEEIGGRKCWVLDVRPRQILQGQRLFEGLVWVDQVDLAAIQMSGRAVPQMLGKNENLFPRFTTTRKLVDGKHWFPEKTFGDDVLEFRSGPLRMRMTIEYRDYKRFSAESTVRFNP